MNAEVMVELGDPTGMEVEGEGTRWVPAVIGKGRVCFPSFAGSASGMRESFCWLTFEVVPVELGSDEPFEERMRERRGNGRWTVQDDPASLFQTWRRRGSYVTFSL